MVMAEAFLRSPLARGAVHSLKDGLIVTRFPLKAFKKPRKGKFPAPCRSSGYRHDYVDRLSPRLPKGGAEFGNVGWQGCQRAAQELAMLLGNVAWQCCLAMLLGNV
jgi:hypothetical protein